MTDSHDYMDEDTLKDWINFCLYQIRNPVDKDKRLYQQCLNELKTYYPEELI